MSHYYNMLYEKLKENAAGDVYPMHMPGHKRNPNSLPQGFPTDIDITEVPGFDDLQNPQGILLETAQLASKLYKSRASFLLTSGSTLGNLTAIGALIKRGDKMLTDSNCHCSIRNAAELFGIELTQIPQDIDPTTMLPQSITPEAVEKAFKKQPDTKLVIITSPSYEGVVSDIYNIADITHKKGALLHVDCAHGAHFGFSKKFPQNPVTLGADTVVMSLHKTLPALTQCSLLHICSDTVDTTKIKHTLNILQTTSPSYILMASIDSCLRELEKNASKLFTQYEQNLDAFYNRVGNLKNLTVVNPNEKPCTFYDFDPGKIIIISKKIFPGKKLAQILREKYKIETEKAQENYVIAMTSICDTSEGFSRLANALLEISEKN